MAPDTAHTDSCDTTTHNEAQSPIGAAESVCGGSATLHIESAEQALARKRLRNPTFPFLTLDPNYIRVVMLQPQAVIVAAADRVGAQDRPLLTEQMKAFLAKAQQVSADLALCPEYSCTWDAVIETVEAGIFPSEGKLWALGCESATPDQLIAALQRLRRRINRRIR